MAAISGKDGDVFTDATQEAIVLSWTASIESTEDAYHSNEGDGWEDSVPGVKRMTGSWIQNDKSSIAVGATVALVLYTGQDIYTLSALILTIVPNVDMKTGTIVNYNVTFRNKGAVTESTGSAPA